MPITASMMPAVNAALATLQADVVAAVNAARDNVKTDVDSKITAARANINNYTDTKGTAVVTAVNAQTTTKAAEINTNTDTKTSAVTTAVNAKGVVKSLQRGIVTFGAQGTQNITIAAVDISKAAVIVASYISNTNFDNAARLTSATNLEVIGAFSSATTCYWQVVEYF